MSPQYPKPQPIPCPRCHKPFVPIPIPELKRLSSFCDTCSARNLLDSLDLPTPPALLDSFSKHPTLSKAEYFRQIKRRDLPPLSKAGRAALNRAAKLSPPNPKRRKKS